MMARILRFIDIFFTQAARGFMVIASIPFLEVYFLLVYTYGVQHLFDMDGWLWTVAKVGLWLMLVLTLVAFVIPPKRSGSSHDESDES